MSDLEGMISEVFSNPEEMKKIMDIAGRLMGSEGAPESAAPAALPGAGSPAEADVPSGAEIERILAGMSGLTGLASAAQSLLDGPAVRKLLSSKGVKSLLSPAAGSSAAIDRRALITALGPLLSEQRRVKLEKAVAFTSALRFAGAAALKGGG